MSSRVDAIRTALQQSLQPELLEIFDDSASHAGHAGARSGGGHFYATIVADAFEGKTPIQRHQLVYQALGDLMRSEIHAISIKAFTQSEYQHKESH
jgi:BolA family transcriptional regulator, general stress-responsive regulator